MANEENPREDSATARNPGEGAAGDKSNAEVLKSQSDEAKLRAAVEQATKTVSDLERLAVDGKAHIEAVKATVDSLKGLLAESGATSKKLSELVELTSIESNTLIASQKQNVESVKVAADEATQQSAGIAPLVQQAKALLATSTKTSEGIPPIVDQIKAWSVEAAPALEQIKTVRADVLQLLEVIKTDQAKTAEIARIADEKDKRVGGYEADLRTLKTNYDKLFKDLQDLLPAATGVGLAKSFNDRKLSLKFPIQLYFGIFVCSVLGFIILGVYGLAFANVSSLEQFFKFLLERLPIVVGLILLEEFSRRQYSATTKLEEDYAYKETISIAFDGYAKAMKSLDSSPDTSLTSQFSKNVIQTLSLRPGRLLETDDQSSGSLTSMMLNKAGEVVGQDNKSSVIDVAQKVKQEIQSQWLKVAGLIAVLLALGVGAGHWLTKYFGDKSAMTVPPATTVPAASRLGDAVTVPAAPVIAPKGK